MSEVQDPPTLPPVLKTTQMQKIERDHGGRDIRLLMKDIYEEQGSQSAVAKELGVEWYTITLWALRLGVKFSHTCEIRETQ